MTQADVLKVFRDRPTDIFTAREVHAKLHKKGIEVSLNTVYVSLRKLMNQTSREITVMEGYSPDRGGQTGRFFKLRRRR